MMFIMFCEAVLKIYGMMALNEHHRMMTGDLISHNNNIKTWERSPML